uniref:NADH-ubiquinone oxidoreductase chain 2 n=1 Tax=Mukaria splendida TaxID=2586309 RepID=A0A7L8ZU34_9HEMI|nr:NADH dehydrogenase subunit 2 [Mukaria splendida]QOI73915.1 NADH dehydrogenase subunit 2 [Mukaria splendida]
MMLNLTKFMLTNTMMIGVIMTICSNNWISMWMGLEISMLSFIPLMINKKIKSPESMIKYFIMQSIASSMFLYSMIILLIGVNMNNEFLMNLSMIMKMGLAPFHNWMLLIIETMDYYVMFIMMTIMKIPPMVILIQCQNSATLTSISLMSLLFSSISCVNQSSVRKNLTYSSIFNNSLMLMSINSMNVVVLYMMIYSMSLMMTMLMMSIMKTNFVNQLMFNEFSIWMKMNFWLNMLSMGGFPSLIGFSAKMMILQEMIMKEQMILLLVVVLTSLLMIMFYTRMAFMSMMFYHTFNKWMLNLNKPVMFFMSMNLFTTPIFLTLLSIT